MCNAYERILLRCIFLEPYGPGASAVGNVFSANFPCLETMRKTACSFFVQLPS